ncbi:tryptophan 7-halogenase [Microvirga sp. SRT01]|uniref:Tryptophan 7-halogenase n=1 Tax=Sphingomonas longa TaxID=2778730 RepID=A0ABS2DAX6_9SPHN|nr:tryptophan halogenase family protein [Microvirga sp. SRT01]MBM6578089.1 tryptophan 7-halogenase [Sphingomonas sp. BT552]MBR7711130.1 tryptophan 7-halogenase [Microvirga sp. SRT01]
MSADVPRPIRKVVIVGGGTAGWMAAAALSRLTAAGVAITLVESEDIGTIGVGEATIPSLHDFNRLLGIDEDAFVRATRATFKLGIEFVGWGRIGDRYMHPFGTHGRDVEGVKFHQLWLRQSRIDGAAGDVGRLDEYCLSAVAAHAGRFTRPSDNPATVLASLGYAFHFDAGLYGRYLRQLSERTGVTRIEGRVTAVERSEHNGHIAAVVLDGGRRIDGELFVDCSGFRSLLLGDAMGVAFDSWQHWLPCDRALAVPSTSTAALLPYTRATAGTAGWRWRIPLQHRVGNGHVYASAFQDEAQAEDDLLRGLDGAALGDARRLRFVAGVRQRLWEGNCVALGLAGGFLEPLESTSIHLVQSGISRLLSLFPDTGFASAERDEYNRLLRLEYEQIRDFIILHYHATTRDDSPFWNHCRTMDIPASLSGKIALWRSRARVIRDQGGLFTDDSWIAVLAGQEPAPTSYDPLVDTLPVEEAGRFMHHLRDMIAKTAAAMPRHDAFIDRHCRADLANAA